MVEYMGLPHRDKTEADYATDRQILREAMQFSFGQVVRAKYSCCPCESVANELNVAFSDCGEWRESLEGGRIIAQSNNLPEGHDSFSSVKSTDENI